jgi:hypothetical protein
MAAAQFMRIKTTLVLGALVVALVSDVSAAPVTFWFSGHVENVNNPSNAMPFGVAAGTPFAGQLTYDPALIGSTYTNSYPGGDIGFYYFTSIAGYSIVFQIAGHTITNVVIPGRHTGLVGVYDQYNNSDSYWAQSSGGLTIDGSPFLADPYFSGIYIYLQDNSKTAINTTDIPTNAPVLANFPDQRALTWGAYIDDGGPTQLFSVNGVLTAVSTNELVLLNCRVVAPNTLQLGWPATLSGFTLQSRADLTAGNWQTVSNAVVDVNAEHTVTIPAAESAGYFRLKK